MQETNVSGTAAKCHHQAEALEALGKSVTRLGSALGTMGEAQESLASNLADAADKTRQHCSVSELELNRSLTTLEDVVKNIGAALSAVVDMRQQVLKRSAEVEAIAFQSKILAINASVEAARVGQAGAGFSVVAQEMSRLSQNSRETADHIRSVVTSSEKSVSDLARNFEALSTQQRDMVSALKQGLKEISGAISSVERTSDASRIRLSGEQASASQICSEIKHGVEDNSRFLAELIGDLTGVQITDMPPKHCHACLSYLTVIDVRGQDEFHGDLGHIEGAQLITLSDDFGRKMQQLDPARPYLFVCRSGGRSSRAARLAQAAGLPHLANLEGGMLAWKRAGLPVAG